MGIMWVSYIWVTLEGTLGEGGRRASIMVYLSMLVLYLFGSPKQQHFANGQVPCATNGCAYFQFHEPCKMPVLYLFGSPSNSTFQMVFQVPFAANGCAYFQFHELCEMPLGAADYIGLFSKFSKLYCKILAIDDHCKTSFFLISVVLQLFRHFSYSST